MKHSQKTHFSSILKRPASLPPIAREYSSSIFDFIIQINKEKNQLLIKTINYCNENNINNKEVKKLRNYEISKLNKLCSNNNRMFYQSHHDNEIITVILINL